MDEAFRAYDVIVIGAGPVGENVADRGPCRRAHHRDRGARTARWRVLVLGLRTQRGLAAARGGPRRRAAYRDWVTRCEDRWTWTPSSRTATGWPPTARTRTRSTGSTRSPST